MKNQYFGDINDYRKYGLLRLLAADGEITTAVCWMLTPDDGRTDGRLIKYLEQPEKWRHLDPPLFDHLTELVLDQDRRDLRGIETPAILPACRFAPGLLADDAEARAKYFETFTDIAEDCDLVFFDPDNGVEVTSKPYGRKGSSKYVYWRELIETFRGGHSLLIYQHFPRIKRERFIQTIARGLAVRTGAREVCFFRAPNVLFLLAPQERHRGSFRKSSKKVEDVWGSQIEVASHRARREEHT